ncbi:hypothetical protein C943_01641 [Mariniradius saccharolyticus AK6]|uniref:Uncharacterized protein n=1 Tax=Mariniradius saccharolyticus AK6 TaxID=1239962 RepID=M7Y3T5_9BACT|nr:hypothetical protein [Mariniradius saccharolyticus]EMS31906.1 hypothetical protein C943_01641 [Mariniradius saccharolyticus AK6]
MDSSQYSLVVDIMIGLAIAYFVLEVLLNLNDIDNDTSNLLLYEWSKGKFFFIPFALGAIAGHLFLGTTDSSFKMTNGMYPVLILFGAVIAMVVIGYKVKFEKSKLLLTILLAVGLVYGHLFWSMNYQL